MFTYLRVHTQGNNFMAIFMATIYNCSSYERQFVKMFVIYHYHWSVTQKHSFLGGDGNTHTYTHNLVIITLKSGLWT